MAVIRMVRARQDRAGLDVLTDAGGAVIGMRVFNLDSRAVTMRVSTGARSALVTLGLQVTATDSTITPGIAMTSLRVEVA